MEDTITIREYLQSEDGIALLGKLNSALEEMGNRPVKELGGKFDILQRCINELEWLQADDGADSDFIDEFRVYNPDIFEDGPDAVADYILNEWLESDIAAKLMVMPDDEWHPKEEQLAIFKNWVADW